MTAQVFRFCFMGHCLTCLGLVVCVGLCLNEFFFVIDEDDTQILLRLYNLELPGENFYFFEMLLPKAAVRTEREGGGG